MAKFYSIETPIHVNGYERFRYNKLEIVSSYWRRRRSK